MSTQSDSKSLSAEEIFDSLTLDEKSGDKKSGNKKPSSEQPKAPPPRRPMGRPPRQGENVPPPNSKHRPTRSQEEALRARKMQGGGPRPNGSSPQRKPPPRRPRRNSESSLMDFDAQPLTEEEKKMIEARRRAGARGTRESREGREGREGREKSESRDRDRESREPRGKGKSHRPSRRMDIIDQLDATSIYGTGLFHHDGPYDALVSHRNKGSSRRAPMQAFPKDSLNNSLGGAGPLNSQPDHSTFMGVATEEAFRDFSGKGGNPSSRKDVPIFDPIARGSIIHGDESYGLGTSTFLEGTPAARTAIVRKQEEDAQVTAEMGIQRKKSLAQRIRHVGNKGPRGELGRANTEAGYSRRTPEAMASGNSTISENNPFFSEFSKGEDTITVEPRGGTKSPTSPPITTTRRPSVGATLERRATTDAATSAEDGGKPMGILGRMKSLKGGRRGRPEGPTAPGTAV